METLEIKRNMTMQKWGDKDNTVSLDIISKGRKVCRYISLLQHYNVSVDVLLEHYVTFDSMIITMGELSEQIDSVRKATSGDGEEFLRTSVLNNAIQFKNLLREIIDAPTRYMLDFFRDRELHNPIYFSVIPMSDPVVEECEAHPHAMAVAIMGGKVADALMFIPNMLEWSTKFPEMKNIASDLVELAKEAKVLVQQELEKIPSEAEHEKHPLFFTWWHLDHVNYHLEYNLEHVQL